MKKLYAPWRADYTTGSAHKNSDTQSSDDCVFCKQIATPQDDHKHFILKRFKHNLIMLNLYPYNAGHILILSNEHSPSLHKLGKEARIELMELVSASVEILKKTLNAHGVNVGLNLGKAAGAGIPSHLHMHVLPRFVGDTNFMPTLANTKVISFDLLTVYEKLRSDFEQLVLPQ